MNGRGVSFLLGERKWQHQNVKTSFLHALNAKSVTMRQARIQQQTQKEWKLQSSAHVVGKEPFIKKPNKNRGFYV